LVTDFLTGVGFLFTDSLLTRAESTRLSRSGFSVDWRLLTTLAGAFGFSRPLDALGVEDCKTILYPLAFFVLNYPAFNLLSTKAEKLLEGFFVGDDIGF